MSAATLPKRLNEMEQKYGVLFAGVDEAGRDLWEVGPVDEGGRFIRSYIVHTDGHGTPTHCPCASRERPGCKHVKHLFRVLNSDAERGPCPDCRETGAGGVMFSARVDVPGRGSLYVHVCDVCSKRRQI